MRFLPENFWEKNKIERSSDYQVCPHHQNNRLELEINRSPVVSLFVKISLIACLHEMTALYDILTWKATRMETQSALLCLYQATMTIVAAPASTDVNLAHSVNPRELVGPGGSSSDSKTRTLMML